VDTLTHALSGALCARASAPREASPDALPLGRRILVGFCAAAFPDLDVVTSWISPLSYLYNHRGVTHSLLMLPLWAFALAWLCALIWRRDRNWRAYFGVIALALGIHIAGDWITSFGTMVLAPFSDERFKLSTTFIIDLWFTGIILAGLLVSLAWRRSRVPAVAGIAVLAAYVGFQYVQQQRAIDFAEAYARSTGIQQARISAMPRPVSPFNWMVVVEEEGERYHYALISLSRREMPAAPTAQSSFIERLAAPYLPLAQAVWLRAERYGTPQQAALARQALQQPQLEFFRWFAEYPMLYRVDSGNPSTCVWFQDLRFLTPGRNAWPFRYGVCREGGGAWTPYQLGDGNARLPVY
jgi:inner membrane protein